MLCCLLEKNKITFAANKKIMPLITYAACVCCKSTAIQKVLNVVDYTVSQKTFEVWACSQCGCRFTQAVPDATEIGVYYQSSAYISHSDTQEGFINKVYHWVRNYTLQTKATLIKKYTRVQQGSLLDIGAGTGAFAHTMHQQGWEVTGLEPDATASSIAATKYGVQFQLPHTLYNLQQSFNAITLWHVLEHVHDVHGYFTAFHKLLQPNGKLFIAVPNYHSADAAYYQQYWAAYDVPRHLYHFNATAMQHLAKQHGFAIIAYKPMWFDSVYVSMLSEQYKTGKQNIVKALWQGCKSNFAALFNTKKCSSIIYVFEKI
jgi:2-polyprenyl-3-methyl-5-hydroxy-6-metoxy-1,4-benzoquinol methylase